MACSKCNKNKAVKTGSYTPKTTAKSTTKTVTKPQNTTSNKLYFNGQYYTPL
jgi:ribosomal protein L37AE/L43A